MRMLVGPAGSGKTSRVLGEAREALRHGKSGIRLLVPTASMAHLLRNQLAREGFLLRRNCIGTLNEFIAAWTGDVAQAPEPELRLLIEDTVRRLNRAEFGQAAHLRGFGLAVLRTMEELSTAGCDSARLASAAPETPLAPAFTELYAAVEAELARRGLGLRGRRLEIAAARIGAGGLNGIEAIWMDGFHALPEPELRLIAALARHAEIVLTIDSGTVDSETQSRLREIGFREEPLKASRANPALALVRTPSMEREVEEIARRILEQARSGRPLREIAIIVRPASLYVPILESTLERFGIPARFYFDSALDRHPVTRFLSGIVDAMLAGWDHGRLLAALRLAPNLVDSDAMDRLDFAVREQLPNSGLGAFRAVLLGEHGCLQTPGSERLLRFLDRLPAIEEWPSFTLTPGAWAQRLSGMKDFFRPSPLEPGELPQLRRGQAEALRLFDAALEQAAQSSGALRAIPLKEFWPGAKKVLGLKQLRLPDDRRETVHVLSAHEARQWVLPVVFVCGMVEKQFPQSHTQDVFFPDQARMALRAAGIRVRTAAEFEREERELFQTAISRGTMLVTLSYPEFDSRGGRNLPSIFLDGLPVAVQEARDVRPVPSRQHVAPAGKTAIHAPALLDALQTRTARVSATSLESYLQCPFQYFGSRLLRLRTAPLRPERRLDFRLQGNIVHEVLAAWWAGQQDIGELFERTFQQYVEDWRIPIGYHTERLRNAMAEDLRAFVSCDTWPREAFDSRVEEPFSFPLEGVEICGKIDRLDIDPEGRAYIVDYKYSAAQRTKTRPNDPHLLQAPLYLMAAERAFGLRAAGMFYVGLKGDLVYAGWEAGGAPALPRGCTILPFPDDWFAETTARTLRALGQIRSGRIEPQPSDRGNCRFCDCRDVCRIETQAAIVQCEGA